jgi:1-pyrroline-5-carboxylate dehydrogenase
MTTHTSAAQPKITYSAIGGNLEEIHASFDAALGKIDASFGKSHHPLIAGTTTAGAGPAYESRSPIDRDLVLGSFHSPSSAQIDAAVAAARSAQKTWALTPWKDRVGIMRDLAEMIRARRYELAAILSVEIGKTRFESLGDAEEAADLIDYYASQFEANDGFVRPLGKLAPNEVTQDVLRPYGVFAVIAPFNFPASLAAGMSGAALLAGNAVVFKPAEDASLTGATLAEIFAASKLPPGLFNCIYGIGEITGAALTAHPGIDGIAFTGSHEVGMHLLQTVGAAGRYVKPVLAELGGKNAAIVTASADLEMASEGVMRSAFGLQGQKCSACSRVYVDARVAKAFLALLLEKTQALVIGDPRLRDVYMGPVINEAAFNRFEGAVKSARSGGTLLHGGERVVGAALDRGYYVQPTIAQLPLDHPLFAQELFLPFLSIGIVDSFDEALREANRSDFGLTGGLFSQDEGEIARFFDEAEAGVLYVNRRTGATTGAWPGVQSFCGWKGSGLTGRGGCGPYYPAQFMREQSHTRMTQER